MNNLEHLQLAVDAARAAGALLAAHGGRTVTANLPRDVKVRADLDSDALIRDRLRVTRFPILSEETVPLNQPSARTYWWVVDPLDGSLNYSRQIPLYTISVALWQGMQPVLGVVYDPVHQEMFSGIVTEGAWLNDSPVGVSDIAETADAVLCTGFPVAADFSDGKLAHLISEIQAYKKVRLLGSAALSLAYVAAGRTDAYRESGIALWDVAGGLALVQAAGGRTDVRPTEMPHRYHVTADNGLLTPTSEPPAGGST